MENENIDNNSKSVYNSNTQNSKEDDVMTSKNYEYFKENFETLYSKYKDKYIVIKDCNIIGVFDSFDEAVTETLKTEKLGEFSIQHCSRDEIEGANFYNNNVVFGVG